MIAIAKYNGYSPQTPYRTVYGPGVAVSNVDEALLTPATGTTLTDAQIMAFINSGDVLGATDDGLELTFEPEYNEDEFAGVPGNVRGGKRFVSAEVGMSGSFTEITTANMKKFIPMLKTADWNVGSTTPTQVGDILTIDPYIVDTDYMQNLAILGERNGTNIPMVSIIYNVTNSEGFSLALSGDETRSNTDVNFQASYGQQTYDAITGQFAVPLKMYLPTEAVAPAAV